MTATQMPPPPSLAAGSDTGISTSDGLTDLATPTFTGTAVAGAKVTLYDTDGTTVIGTATANGIGVWSIVALMPLDDGPHSFTVTAQVPGFDVSPRSAGLAVTIDTAAPDAPTAPVVTADTDTGASAIDGVTANGGKGKPALVLKGQAEPGATVQVFNGASKTALATVTAGADGTYTAALTGLKDDTYSFTAIATDPAGNVGKPSGASAVTVDTVAPATPAAPTLTPGSDTGTLHNDGTTSDTTPTLVGTAEAGATVALFDTDGLMIGKAKADAAGAYAITVPVSSELVSGAHALTVKAVDAAGNTSAASDALNIVVDTTPATATSTPTLSFFGGVGETFSVHFGEAVSKVTASDFVLTTTGTAVGSIQGVSGSGRDYTVTVNGLAGAGDVGLDFSPTSQVTDLAGNPVSFSESDDETIDDTKPETSVGIVSSSAAGVAGTGAHASPSASGRIVAFDSSDGQLVTGGPAGAIQNVYVKDMQTGGISLISVGTDGPADHDSWFPSLSQSATTIAFVSAATNLVAGGTPAGQFNLYVANLTLADPNSGNSVTVVPGSLRLVASGISNELNATFPGGLPDPDIDHKAPEPAFLSADGSTVAFLSASVLAAGATSGGEDNVYLKNLSTGALTFVGNGYSVNSISADGTKIAYVGDNETQVGTELSEASYSAIHVYDATSGQTTVLDGNAFSVDGTPGDAVTPVPVTPTTVDQSYDYVETVDPKLSGDGTKVFYLVENEFPGNAFQDDINGLLPQQAAIVETNLVTGVTTEISPIIRINSATSSTASKGGGLVLYGNPDDDSLALYDAASRTTTPIAVGDEGVSATLTSGGNAATFNTEPSEIVNQSQPSDDTYNYVYDFDLNMFLGGASDSTAYETNFGVTAGIDPIGTRGEIGAAALAKAIANGGFPVSGTTDAPQGSTVVVAVADATTGGFSAPFAGTVTTGGRWTASIPVSVLQALAAESTQPGGSSLALSVQVGTPQGASFQALLPFTLDTTAPATPDAPKLDAGSDVSVGHVGTLTNRDQPVITGTAEAGSTVTLTDTDFNTVVGQGTADSQGVYAITAKPLTQGLDHLAVTATDAAGNVSASSAVLALTVDSVAPATLAAPKLAAGSDTGASDSDGITDTATPTITGSDAEAGTTVTLYDTDGIAVLGTATVDAKGNYSITPAGLSDGAHTLTVTATDRAGNVSPGSAPLQVTIDTLPPLAPTIDDGVGKLAITGQTVDVTGTAEPGTTVTLQVDGGNIDFGQATVDSFGDYDIDSDTLSPGAHKLTVIATDTAGNASQPSLTANVTIAGGKVPPPAPPPLPQPGAPDGTPLADGVASDGYIAGATVFGDANGNGVLDPGEDSTTTDAVGRFSTYGGNSPLVLTGGIDTGTGVALPGNLNAPAGATVITPLTTYYDAFAKVTGQALSDTVYGNASASLGIDPSGYYTNLDPVDQIFYEASFGSGNPLYAGFGIAEAKLMDTAADIAAVIGGSGGVVATGFSAAFDAIARAAAASPNPIDLDSAATIQAILADAALEAAPTTVVDPAVAAAAAQAIAAGNTALDGFNYSSPSALTVTGDIDAAETVAQGALATALTGAAKDPTLAPAILTDFTGTALTAAIDGDEAVVLPAPVLAAASDTGRSPGDEITSLTTPTFIGTAAPGSTVTLVDSDLGSGTEGASLIVGTGKANAQGLYSIATSVLSYGKHEISAIQTPPGTSLNIGLATRTALAQAIDNQGFIQTDPAHVALIPDGSSSVLVDVDIASPQVAGTVSITTVAAAAGNGGDATHTALLVAGKFSSPDNDAAKLIQVYVDGATTPAASGQFTRGLYDLTLPALANGPHTLVVTETTIGGAVIAQSSPFSATVAAAPVLSGKASGNGGLVGASVFEDADETGYGGPTGAAAPYDDPAATTDGAGGFSFAPVAVDPNRDPPAASLAATIVEGGWDSVTGLPLGGATALANGKGPGSAVLEAPFGYGQVNALTSVVESFVAHEEAIAYYGSIQRTYEPIAVALAAAEPEAIAALDLPAATDLSTLDPLGAAESGSPAAFLENAKLLDTFTMLAPFLGNSGYGNLVNLVVDGESTNLDDPATILDLLQSDISLAASDKQNIAAIVAASNTAIDAYAAKATGPADLISHTLAVETVAQEAETAALLSAENSKERDPQYGNDGFTGFATIASAFTGDALTAAVATALGQTVQVTSFLPAGTAPTKATTVDYVLTLSRPVSGVTAADFSVIASNGLSGVHVTGVSAVAGSGGASYDVSVATGIGQGTIALGFTPKDLTNADGSPLNYGLFESPAFYTNNSQAAVGELAAGDFNGDGKPDIVSVNNDGDETTGLTLYLNRGDGTFASQPAIHTGPDFNDSDAYPSAVVVGDFNGDGKLDVAVANSTGVYKEAGVTANTVSVLLGNGDGTFQAPVVSTAPLFLTDIAAGDFNGDGKLDIVTASSIGVAGGSSLNVQFGNGDGTFTAGPTLAFSGVPGAIAVADLDGHPDIIATDSTGNDVAIYKSNGDGTFQPAETIATGQDPTGLAVGDVNGDGIPDIVAVNQQDGTLSVLLGKGDGTFTSLAPEALGSPVNVSNLGGQDQVTVTVGDLNGDGKADLLVRNEYSQDPLDANFVLLGNGDGTFQPGYGVGGTTSGAVRASLQNAVLGDFDGDGRTDIASPAYDDAAGSENTSDGNYGIDVLTDTAGSVLPATSAAATIDRPAAAAPVVTELAGGGTLTQSGNTYTLDLGTLTLGQAAAAVQFALTNAAASGADAFDGIFGAPAGTGFTVAGASLPAALSAGQSYGGLAVTVDTTAPGAHTETLTFAPRDETDASGRPTTLAAADLASDDPVSVAAAVLPTDVAGELPVLTLVVTDDVEAPAAPLATLGAVSPVTFGKVRVGTPDSRVLPVVNTATAAGAGSLDVSATAGGQATVTGSVSDLAPGATDASDITVGLDTSAAGARSGSVTLAASSDTATGTPTPVPGATVAVSGAVYRPAAPAVAPVSAVVHVGDPGTVSLSVANADPADGFSENLVAALTGTTGAVTGSGKTGEIAAGASDATSLALSFSTATAGVIAGTATVGLTSDGGAAGAASAIDGLGTLALPSASVPVSITVDNFAQAALAEASGGGTLTATADGYTLDLGTVAQGSAPVTVALAALNAAAGPADLLSGSFTASGSAAFTNALTAVAGVAAGGSQAAGTVTLSTASAGAASDTIAFAATGSNASGYSGALAGKTLTIRADVAAKPPAATPPTVTAVAVSGLDIAPDGSGDLGAGRTVTITATTSAPVTVAGGTPTLALNNGGVATFAGGSGTNLLTFTYTVATGQDTPDLSVTGIAGNGATVADAAGSPLDLASLATTVTPAGALAIDTTPPTVSSPSLTVAQNAPATSVGIVTPADALTPAAGLAIAVGSLPTDGTVTLADGTTPVSAGESLTVAQLAGLTFTPTPGASGQASTFTYTATDGAGNAATGSAAVSIGPPGAPSIIGTHPGIATSGAPATPFERVTVSDPSVAAGATDTLTITLTGGGGMLVDGAGFSGLIPNADGSYTLSGMAGSRGSLTAELDALRFAPTYPGSATTFVLKDVSSTGTGTTDAGTTVTDTTVPAAPTAPPVDGIVVDQDVTHQHDGTFTLTGHVSSSVGVKGVEFTASIDGQLDRPVDLGAATVEADGTFAFTDRIGGLLQGFITATETDDMGLQTQADFRPALQGGAHPHVDRYTVTSTDATYTGSTYFESDGSHRVTVTAPGQTLRSDAFDTFANHGAPDTTFVFNPGFGRDVVSLFRVDGTDHDTLSFKGSDFGNDIATVLANAQDTKAGLLITDPTASSPGAGGNDTLLLKGITKQQFAANQGDIAFHA